MAEAETHRAALRAPLPFSAGVQAIRQKACYLFLYSYVMPINLRLRLHSMLDDRQPTSRLGRGTTSKPSKASKAAKGLCTKLLRVF